MSRRAEKIITGFDQIKRVQRRKQVSRFVATAIVVLVVMLITIMMIVRLLGQAKPLPRLMFLAEEKVIEKILTRGVVARDEHTLDAPSSGVLKPSAAEGSHVAKGQKLATIWPSEQLSVVRELQKAENDLVDVQLEVMYTEQGKGMRQLYEAVEPDIRGLIAQIRAGTAEHDLGSLGLAQTSLGIMLQRRSAELRKVDVADPRLEELLLIYRQKEQQLGVDLGTLVSDRAGLLSYRTDGLEGTLSPEVLLVEDPAKLLSYLKTPPPQRDGVLQTQNGQPIVRLIDDLEQYFVVQVPAARATELKIGNVVTCSAPDLRLTIPDCEIVRAETREKDLFLVLKTNKQVERLCDFRTIALEIWVKERSGLREPRTALLNFDNKLKTARLMKVVKGFTRLEDVAVTALDDEFALVESLPGNAEPLAVSSIVVLNPQEIKADEQIGS